MIVKFQTLRRFVFQQRRPAPVSMLCDVSCDEDKMLNVGTVAVGVLASAGVEATLISSLHI